MKYIYMLLNSLEVLIIFTFFMCLFTSLFIIGCIHALISVPMVLTVNVVLGLISFCLKWLDIPDED